MKMRFGKTALSITTAAATLASTMTVVNAAQRNEITLTSSAESVSAGDTFSVTLGYEPDATGASGFTIDLHFDTEAVNLNIPADGGYSTAGEFAVVTNFTVDDGLVRIVGANLSGSNVKTNVKLGDFSFTVKDGYEGDINFWTDVTTLVASDGSDFVNVDFKAYGPYDPFTVSGPVKEVVTAPVETEPVAEETPDESEAEVKVTEPAAEETKPETEQTTESPELPENYIPEIEKPAPQPAPAPIKPVFVHEQDDEDYNNEEAVQYSFSAYDYITDGTEVVDIIVDVASDGNAQGGIGMQTSDGWVIYGGEIEDSDAETWTAEDVDLNDVYGDISVQLYYQQNNSKFRINSIRVIPAGSYYEDYEADIFDDSGEEEDYYDEEYAGDYEDDDSFAEYIPEQSVTVPEPEYSEPEYPSYSEDSYEDTDSSDELYEEPACGDESDSDEEYSAEADSEESEETEADTGADSEADSETEEITEDEEIFYADTVVDINDAAAPNASGSEADTDSTADTESEAEKTETEEKTEQVEKIVSDASASAGDSNPDTGIAASIGAISTLIMLVLLRTGFIQKQLEAFRAKRS